MPRKTRSIRWKRGRAPDGFNEAAARCHGKQFVGVGRAGRFEASMRPRPDATENVSEVAGIPITIVASMRPRPDATENAGVGVSGAKHGEASMRPRPDATENARLVAPHVGARAASMRPRPDATENVVSVQLGPRLHVASMRPRPDATENPSRSRRASPRFLRFNEAAARCHGKPRLSAHRSRARERTLQ